MSDDPTYDWELQSDETYTHYVFGNTIAYYSPAYGCWFTYRAEDALQWVKLMRDMCGLVVEVM